MEHTCVIKLSIKNNNNTELEIELSVLTLCYSECAHQRMDFRLDFFFCGKKKSLVAVLFIIVHVVNLCGVFIVDFRGIRMSYAGQVDHSMTAN